MKKTHFRLVATLLAAVMMLAACSKNEEEMILGTWVMDLSHSTMHEEYTSSEDPDYNYTDDYTVKDLGMLECSYTFLEDGTAYLYTNYKDEGAFTDTLHYTMAEGKIDFGWGEVYDITKLENDALILDMEGTELDNGDTYVYRVHYELSR